MKIETAQRRILLGTVVCVALASVFLWRLAEPKRGISLTELYLMPPLPMVTDGVLHLSYAVRNRTGTDRTYRVLGTLSATSSATVSFDHDLFVRDGEVRVLREALPHTLSATSTMRIAIQEPYQYVHIDVPPPE